MIRRRDVITLLGGAAVSWPVVARAQQPAVPVIGFLRSTPEAGSTHLVTALKRGLAEGGFRDGENIAIEYRFANDQIDRLPALAGELISRPVAVIVGNTLAARTAKAATARLPIVFVAVAIRSETAWSPASIDRAAT